MTKHDLTHLESIMSLSVYMSAVNSMKVQYRNAKNMFEIIWRQCVCYIVCPAESTDNYFFFQLLNAPLITKVKGFLPK